MVEELGPFRKADPVVVEDDPFWSVVRRRHPDVDIVLLPPEPERAEPDEVSDPAVVRTATGEVLAARQLLRSLVDDTDVPDAAAPTVRWDLRDGGHSLVIQQALRGLGEEGGTALLRAAALALGRAGWRLRPTTRDGHPLLEVTDGRTHVRVEAGAAATVLTVSAARLVTGADLRAELAEQVRRAVASWE